MNVTEGHRWRDEFLKKGASENEMEVLKAYLGREPHLESFFEEYGMI